MNSDLQLKYTKLKQLFDSHANEGICIAYSGGVDSSLLLKIACDINQNSTHTITAVTFNTSLHPFGDINECVENAKLLNTKHIVLNINEFSNPLITSNPLDRCYQCKKLLFTQLLQVAQENNCSFIVDGTNFDDSFEYRPGIRALSELGIVSPLLQLKFTKEDIRSLAKHLGIPSAHKPSAPCLATRLPYDTHFDAALLQKIDVGETILKQYGLYNVRLRLHNDIARIEVDEEYFHVITNNKNEIIQQLKQLGFTYVTLDLCGFKSGSMDINL